MVQSTDLLNLCLLFCCEPATYDPQIYIDTANSERKLCAEDARTIVRKLIAGFKAFGLKPGDAVCVHSFLDVSFNTSRNGGPYLT